MTLLIVVDEDISVIGDFNAMDKFSMEKKGPTMGPVRIYKGNLWVEISIDVYGRGAVGHGSWLKRELLQTWKGSRITELDKQKPVRHIVTGMIFGQ